MAIPALQVTNLRFLTYRHVSSRNLTLSDLKNTGKKEFSVKWRELGSSSHLMKNGFGKLSLTCAGI